MGISPRHLRLQPRRQVDVMADGREGSALPRSHDSQGNRTGGDAPIPISSPTWTLPRA